MFGQLYDVKIKPTDSPDETNAKVSTIANVLYEKLSTPSFIPMVRKPWVIGGFPCSKHNIKIVVGAYIGMVRRKLISKYDPFNKSARDNNRKIVTKVTDAVKKMRVFKLKVAKEPTDIMGFVKFILIQLRGWDAFSYDAKIHGKMKSDARKKMFKESFKDTARILKKSAVIGAGAIAGWKFLPIAIPLAYQVFKDIGSRRK